MITTNRWASRQAVCSAASVIPTTGPVAISRAAVHAGVAEAGDDERVGVGVVLADLLEHAEGGERLLGVALHAGHPVGRAGRRRPSRPGPETSRAAAAMVSVSSAEVLGLITVIARHRGDRRSSRRRRRRAARSTPGPPTAMRAARRRSAAASVGVTAAQVLGREGAAEGVAGAGAVHRGDHVGGDDDGFGAFGLVATRQPASARLITTTRGPRSRKAAAAAGQVGRAGQGGGLDLAGQEHVAARDGVDQRGLVAGDVVLLRVEVDRGARSGSRSHAASSSCGRRAIADSRTPAAAGSLARDVGRVHRERLEVLLAADQVPARLPSSS